MPPFIIPPPTGAPIGAYEKYPAGFCCPLGYMDGSKYPKFMSCYY